MSILHRAMGPLHSKNATETDKSTLVVRVYSFLRLLRCASMSMVVSRRVVAATWHRRLISKRTVSLAVDAALDLSFFLDVRPKLVSLSTMSAFMRAMSRNGMTMVKTMSTRVMYSAMWIQGRSGTHTVLVAENDSRPEVTRLGE